MMIMIIRFCTCNQFRGKDFITVLLSIECFDGGAIIVVLVNSNFQFSLNIYDTSMSKRSLLEFSNPDLIPPTQSLIQGDRLSLESNISEKMTAFVNTLFCTVFHCIEYICVQISEML